LFEVLFIERIDLRKIESAVKGTINERFREMKFSVFIVKMANNNPARMRNKNIQEGEGNCLHPEMYEMYVPLFKYCTYLSLDNRDKMAQKAGFFKDLYCLRK
jgi:hypothetical protein